MKITCFVALLAIAGSLAIGPGSLAQESMPCHGCYSHGATHFDDFCCPRLYGRLAKFAVLDACAAQSEKGRILDLTVWNHHFNAGSAELRPSGLSFLNRLARRQQGSDQMEVFLQTTRDIPYDSEKPEVYASNQERLDLQRVKAVGNYIKQVLKRDVHGIVVFDPDLVGMSATEAAATYQLSVETGSLGALPREYILGTQTTSKKK